MTHTYIEFLEHSNTLLYKSQGLRVQICRQHRPRSACTSIQSHWNFLFLYLHNLCSQHNVSMIIKGPDQTVWMHMLVRPFENMFPLPLSCLLLIFSQSDCLVRIVPINSHTSWQTVQIQISWLLQKPTDLDLHCCKGRVYPGSALTRINTRPFLMCFSHQWVFFYLKRLYINLCNTSGKTNR